jgi:hypothetical protein
MERTHAWGMLAGAVTLAVAVGAGGCNGDLDMGQQDAGVDAQTDTGPPQLVVRVLEGRRGQEVTSWTPVSGAVVALDTPGGGLVEEVSGLDGRARFADVDFTLGTAAVTAHVAGRQLASVLGVADLSEEVVVLIPPSPIADSFVTGVTGEFLNVGGTAGAYSVRVGALGSAGQEYGHFAGTAPEYSLAVPANATFTLVALVNASSATPSGRGWVSDYLAWAMRPDNVVTASVGMPLPPHVIDIDFASATETKSVDGWFALPTASGSVLREKSTGSGSVDAAGGDVLVGWPVAMDVDADGAGVNYTMTWVEPPGVDRPTTVLGLTVPDTDGGGLSLVRLPGYPTAGVQGFQLLDCPRDFAASGAGLASTFTWTQTEEGTGARIFFYRGQVNTWILDFPGDLRSITLPTLPSTVDPAAHFGGETLSVVLVVADWGSATAPQRFAYSGLLELQP